MATELPDYLKEAQQGAQTALEGASKFASYSGSIPDILKQKVQQAYKDNQDVISQLDTSTANYLSSPAVAREKYQNIFNPFQRESLVSQYTANQSIPMMSWSGIYGQRMGRAGDLIDSATGAYQTEAATKQAAAQSAQQNFENLLKQYQLEEDKRRWEASQSGGNFSILDWLNQREDVEDSNFVPESTAGFTSGVTSGSSGGTTNTSSSGNMIGSILSAFLPSIFGNKNTKTGGSW